MQAIKITHLGPTNNKDWRTKASCERGSITIAHDYYLDSKGNSHKVLSALLNKFAGEDLERNGTPIDDNPWMSPTWVIGELKDFSVAVASW